MHHLAFLSTLLIHVGIFLPWIHPSLFIVVTRGIEIKDGKLILAFGLLTSLLAVYGIFSRWRVLGWAYLLIGLTCAGIASLDLYVFWQSKYNVGPGLYLTLVGSIQLALSPLLVRFLPSQT